MAKVGVYSDDKLRQLLQVLKQFEIDNKEVSLQELANASGYKLTSIRTYVGKKLRGFVLSPTKRGRFIVSGARALDESVFVKHMSQRSPVLDSDSLELAPRLLRRSLDAYFLAIELYATKPRGSILYYDNKCVGASLKG